MSQEFFTFLKHHPGWWVPAVLLLGIVLYLAWTAPVIR